MSLEGIGESKAKAIIEYRNKTPFKSIDEIKNVQGIGESLYAKIKEIITV
jgi:competence protein ComEA